jgi:hypothetical protein
MTLDSNLELVFAIVQAIVIVLLIVRRIYKTLPLFSFYLVWLLLLQGASALLSKYAENHTESYERQFFIASVLDIFFLLCVLAELSMSVLKPIRSSLPRWTGLIVVGLLVLAFGVIWKFAIPPGFSKLTPTSQHAVHIDIASSVLRIVFFLVLAGFSQLLALGWRDRELQIATGLGFYSLVSLSVMVLHMNQGASTNDAINMYHTLDRVVGVSYIVSMVYWIVSFVQKVPERREFTPQMQSFLLALAGNARTARVAMSDSSKFKADKGSNSLR